MCDYYIVISENYYEVRYICYRTATARGKAEQADEAADQAKEDCDIAQATAKQFAPDFKHPGFDRIGLREKYRQKAYDAQVAPPHVSQESEKVLDGKSIPNHIPPMHSQIPQNNRAPNAVSSRRPSTQFPKPVQPDPRLANNANYNTDNRTLGPPYDPYYSSNQDNWTSASTSPQLSPDNQKPFLPNEQISPYGAQGSSQQQQSAYNRYNRQDQLQHQQSIDQPSQQFSNQERRLSAATRPQLNQRPTQQDWNAPQAPARRQSVLGQPTFDAQGNAYMDGGAAAYGRNEIRTGTVHSEGPLDRQQMASNQPYRPGMDPQGYRQGLDQQTYGQPSDQMYRQMPNETQAYRQMGHVDQGYRPTAPTEQDIVNGSRDIRAPGQRPSIDYFDHYKRPPSRDSSVDRYGRRSRQPSVEAAAPTSGSRAGSVAPQPPIVSQSRPQSRAATPAGNGHLASGRGSISRAGSRDRSVQPFEDSLLRKRNLGQEISPSPYQPKRTESLYVAQLPAPPPPAPKGGGGGGGGGRKVSSLIALITVKIFNRFSITF